MSGGLLRDGMPCGALPLLPLIYRSELPLYPDSYFVRGKLGLAIPGVAVCSVVAVLFPAACSSGPGAQSGSMQKGQIPVRFFAVEEQVLERRIQPVGSLLPIDQSTISSEVEARVCSGFGRRA